MSEKPKPKLKRNDQGLPGWNLYWDGDLTRLTIYPEAETIYFEVKPRPEAEKAEIDWGQCEKIENTEVERSTSTKGGKVR